MPTPREGESHEEFIDRCIPIVIDDGTAEDGSQANAICNSIWEREMKTKEGEKNNEAETLIAWGGEIKALGNGKIGGYLVRFTDENEPDLEGEFFTKDTDFGDAAGAPVYYNHGLDAKLGKRKIGRAAHKVDDFGVWAEAQLNLRDEYEKFIYAMAEKGKMGWSSGTASHLVERQHTAKATWIKSWPLGLDDTLTPWPAEPKNEATPLKSWEPPQIGVTMTERIEILNAEIKVLNSDLGEFINGIDKPLSGVKRKELKELLEQCSELNTVYSDLEEVLKAEPYGKRAASKQLLYQLAEKRKSLSAMNILQE